MLGKPVYLEIIFSEQPMVLGIREKWYFTQYNSQSVNEYPAYHCVKKYL